MENLLGNSGTLLRAMAVNYARGHSWDKLDSQVCNEAADLIDKQRHALERIKFRLHFMGWPGEPMWQAHEGGRWNPDWRYEISVLEHALHGSPIDNPEKPTDIKRRDEVPVDDAAIERAMRARIPGGSEAWVWLFNCEGGMEPQEKHREFFRRVLAAAQGTSA